MSEGAVFLYRAARGKRFDAVCAFLETKGASREELLLPVPKREMRKRNTVLSMMFGGAPARHPLSWADDWVKASRLVLDIVTPADLLEPVNWVAHAASLKEERIAEMMVEKCMSAPEFTVDAKLKVLENVVSNEWPNVATMLLEGVEPALLVRECFLRWPIQCGNGNTEVFITIASLLTDEQLMACPGKQSLLGTACNTSRWKVARMLLDRTPDALLTTSSIGPVISVLCRPPPLDIWERLVHGTPEELLLRQGYGGRTLMHKVARDFAVDHFKILAARVPPSGRVLLNRAGRSPLDVAEKRARGELKCHYGDDIEQFIAEGQAIARMLSVGSATKAAGIS